MSYDKDVESVRKLQDQYSLLRQFKEHPGFEWFMLQLKQDLEAKKSMLMAPPTEMTDHDARTYIAGEARALHFCLNHVEITMKGIKSSLDSLQVRIDRHEDTEATKPTGDTIQ